MQPNCIKCDSPRIMKISIKCSDCCNCGWVDKNNVDHYHDGYAPEIIGLPFMCGDYVYIAMCLECGQVQKEFPLPDPSW